jgi:hypothetical protein
MCLTHPEAHARLHALYVLEGLDSIDDGILRSLLKDKAPDLREHALMLAEGRKGFLTDILALEGDASGRVAFQAALSIGAYTGPEVRSALLRILLRNLASPWYRMAVLSAPEGSTVEMLESMMAEKSFSDAQQEGREAFLREIVSVIRDRADDAETARLRGILSASAWKGPAALRDTALAVLQMGK